MRSSTICALLVLAVARTSVNAAEAPPPPKPAPNQPRANPKASLPATQVAPQTIKFRNATASDVTVSLQDDRIGDPTTYRCPPGSVATFTITSAGPFEVTLESGTKRFSRSRLDLLSLRRRMRGDTASIQAMADLETDIDAVEDKKVTSTLGAYYVTFPANVTGGVLQALFPPAPAVPTAPANSESFPAPPKSEITSPAANPPESRPSSNPPESRTQPKTP